jgi:hypothetical protein
MPDAPGSPDWLVEARSQAKTVSVDLVAQQRMNILYRVTPLIQPLGSMTSPPTQTPPPPASSPSLSQPRAVPQQIKSVIVF